MVLDATPQPFDVTVDAAVARGDDARAGRPAADGSTDDDLLDMIVAAGLEPRLLYPNGPRRKSRFAFVIHPLSQQFFTQGRAAGARSPRSRPAPVMDVVEKAMAYAPPFTYSHVTGITSPTGAEAEGWLITVGGTPEGADGAQPGVHLRPAARGRRDGPQARRAGDGARARSPRSSATPA